MASETRAKTRNEHVLSEFIDEVFNKGNFDAIDEFVAPDCVEHQFGLHPDREGQKKDFRWLRTAFPDLHLVIEDSVVDGDKVWIRMTASGTNTGPMMGPPTGKPMQITVFDIARFRDGKIVEHWGVPDRFAQMAQLGLLPEADLAAGIGTHTEVKSTAPAMVVGCRGRRAL